MLMWARVGGFQNRCNLRTHAHIFVVVVVVDASRLSGPKSRSGWAFVEMGTGEEGDWLTISSRIREKELRVNHGACTLLSTDSISRNALLSCLSAFATFLATAETNKTTKSLGLS